MSLVFLYYFWHKLWFFEKLVLFEQQKGIRSKLFKNEPLSRDKMRNVAQNVIGQIWLL